MSETCAMCGFASTDSTCFTGDNPPICISCHLELLDESRERPSDRLISLTSGLIWRNSQFDEEAKS